MSGESAPLIDEATIEKVKENLAQAKDKVSDIVENIVEQAPAEVVENLNQCEAAITDKVNEFVNEAKNGNTSIRGLALISGLALVASSIYELFINLWQFQLTFALIAFYSLVMGSVAVTMEVDPEALPYGQKLRGWLLKHIGLVQVSTGRGIFYLVAGSLELTQDETSATLIGLFTVIVAISYIVVGRRATMKVKALRAANYPTFVIRRKFNQFDKDGDGYIDFKEFHDLLVSLDVNITYQGSEMIFVSLDREMDGKLSFEEFERFWSDDPLTLGLIPV